MELYSDRVSDLVKSIASVEKMEQDSITRIGILEYCYLMNGMPLLIIDYVDQRKKN